MTDDHGSGLLSLPHLHHPVPDHLPDTTIVDLLCWAYEQNGPRHAAVILLNSHGFWLPQPEIRRYLVYVNIGPPGTPPEYPSTARQRLPNIELDWQAVERDRQGHVYEPIGDQHDQMILTAALSIAIGRVGQMAMHFNSYTAALFSAAILEVASVPETCRKAQALLVDFGTRRQKSRRDQRI